ncbi:MAG: iron donor protein CyaY [Polyangiaceae bacterium]
MDERQYQFLADGAFKMIEGMFEDIDAEDVDCERAGDVITLTMRGGKKCIVNTQRPTKQIWLAANARAWHFSFDESVNRWKDDKGENRELFETIANVAKEMAGVDVKPIAAIRS